jgi:hypothetical protein
VITKPKLTGHVDMAVLSRLAPVMALMYPLVAGGSIADIDHVVLFMQGLQPNPPLGRLLLHG